MFSLQLRDLKAVGKKFVHVMYPRKSSALLRDCEYELILMLIINMNSAVEL